MAKAKKATRSENNTVEIVPTQEQLKAMHTFLAEKALPNGEAHFTHNDAIEHPAIIKDVRSRTYIGGILSYLANEGYIRKIESGRRHNPTIWDVTYFLLNWQNVKTREEVGKFRIVGRTPPTIARQSATVVEPQQPNLLEQLEVEMNRVADKATPSIEDVLADEPVNNENILRELHTAIDQMTAHLKSLPGEMGTHLNSLSNKLEATTDTKALEALQAKVQQLESERDDLSDQLVTARAAISTLEQGNMSNSHQIYRKGSSILEMVDRMIKVPAWTLKQNGPKMRNEIKSDIEYILKQVGFEEQEKQNAN